MIDRFEEYANPSELPFVLNAPDTFGAYWLREPVGADGVPCVVRGTGYGDVQSYGSITSEIVGVRPMIRLNTAAKGWSYAGKLNNFGNKVKEVQTITGSNSFEKTYGVAPFSLGAKAKGKLTYQSDKPGIAAVSSGGIVTIKSAGTAILRLTVKEYSKRVTIHVMAKVTEISNVDRQIYLQEGERLNLKPQLKPEKFAEEPITYQVKNHKIATVRENGELLGRQAGSTRLVISAGGCQKTVRLQVNPYVPPQPASSYIYREPEKRPSSSESENYEEEINGGEEYWR